MNLHKLLWDAALPGSGRAMPILSFPAAKLLGISVEQLVRDPLLQAQVMETIAQQTLTVAVVSLMDLSVEAEAFGADVIFSPNEVPVITGQLIQTEEDAKHLEVPDPEQGRTGICIDAIRFAKERIPDKPVLGGMIGPFSLAGRLMDVSEIIYACSDEPETVHMVLDKGTKFLLRYGQALKDCGADGIILAEPLAGILSPVMAREFSMPYVKKIIDALQDTDFSVIYHNCGNAAASMLQEIFHLGAAAFHFGNAVDMQQIMACAPADALCMGNIDPASQFTRGTEESMSEAVRSLMDACDAYPNFLISSGCDIPYHAKWENIQCYFQTVSEYAKGRSVL